MFLWHRVFRIFVFLTLAQAFYSSAHMTEQEKRMREETCRGLLQSLYTQSKIEYVNQGAEGVVFKIIDELGESKAIKYYDIGSGKNYELSRITLQILQHYSDKFTNISGIEVPSTKIHPQNSNITETDFLEGGVLLSTSLLENNLKLAREFRHAKERFLTMLMQEFEIILITRESLTDNLLKIHFREKDDQRREGYIVFSKLDNFYYKPSTNSFVLMDPL